MNPRRKEKAQIGTWMPPAECFACGADDSFVRQTLSSEKVAHGETFLVSHEGYECRDCGFAILGPDEMDEAVRAVLDAYHKKHFPCSADTDENSPNALEDFFRCQQTDGRWVFEVGVVVWHSPHEPSLEWKRFRTWKNKPRPERLANARDAAIKRYFRTCKRCQELCNLGHMHDFQTCQGCAELFLGVVH